ncbi:MAG: HNH endonuclease, partial [Candidatus Fonsibacter ubiquis]
MIIKEINSVPLDKCPALVLNADYRPLSYYPLSLW